MSIPFIDLVHIQPYLYLCTALLENKITAKEFETLFLDLRRNDQYYMTGRFNTGFANLIRVLFNAVDDYQPEELYDPTDKYDITEAALRQQVTNVMEKFRKKIAR
jgi:hypothetical protein